METAISSISKRYRLTFQESRLLSAAFRDLEMWRGVPFDQIWSETETSIDPSLQSAERKKRMLKAFHGRIEALRRMPKTYPAKGTIGKPQREKLRVVRQSSQKKIHGDCPVASPETVCCNLKTIDAVENCAFGCSYCTIQTFYGNEAVFDADFKQKLDRIEIDPARFYHYGTGQSSDSLVWGNKEGILDDLCGFARRHSNVLLEFKTKSDNVAYFLQNPVPPNVVCSWSLNTDTVVENEEHFTASLDRRIEAARKVADRGIPVAFHFHPMVYYRGWEQDYSELAQRVQGCFFPEEVLFLSFGSVTFIKPVMQQIRKRGEPTRILQMELVPAPKGKFSYPDELKIRQFQLLFESFRPWHEKVFMYLCMEPAKIWDEVFGWHYLTNEEFEKDFGGKTLFRRSTHA